MGFCVARSTLTGNAKASMRGTSDKHDSHAFFCVWEERFFNIRVSLKGIVVAGDMFYEDSICFCNNCIINTIVIL